MAGKMNEALQAATRKQTPQPKETKSADPIKPRGVGLKTSEWERLDQIGADMGMTGHGVVLYAVRYFLKALDEGKIKPVKQETLPTLDT